MESIRHLIRTNVPTAIMVPIIQGILSLPPTMARYLIADFTAPKRSQMSWIRMIEKPAWKGAWIGPDMAQCHDEGQLLQRIRDADMIIYKAHGNSSVMGCCKTCKLTLAW